jgi:hypothetical protein
MNIPAVNFIDPVQQNKLVVYYRFSDKIFGVGRGEQSKATTLNLLVSVPHPNIGRTPKLLS